MAAPVLTDEDFGAETTGTSSGPVPLSDSDFEAAPTTSTVTPPPSPQKSTYLSDVDTVVGHSADLSHDQVNDAIQTQIYGRPRFNFQEDAPTLNNRQIGSLRTILFGTIEPKVPEESAKAVLRGVEDAGRGVASLFKWLGESLDTVDIPSVNWVAKGISGLGDRAIKFINERQKEGFEAPDPEIFRGSFSSNPSYTRIAAGVARGAPALAAAAALTYATANPLAGAASLGLIGAGEQYESSRELGSSKTRASTSAVISGIGNTLLMSLPLGKFLEGFGKTTAESVAKGAGEFAAVSGAMTPFNNIVARIGGDKARNLFEGMTESILSGAVSGGILGGLTPNRGAQIDQMIQDAHKAGVPAKDIDATRTEIGRQMIDNPEIVQAAIKNEAKAIQKEEEIFSLKPDVEALQQGKKIEAKLPENSQEILTTYEQKHGKYVSVDEMRSLLPEYKGINAPELHETASTLTKAYRESVINKAVDEGNNNFIISSGGPGSGKTTLINSQIEANLIPEKTGAIIDSNLSNFKNASKLIEDLSQKGEVKVQYVYRDPIEAWKGVLSRTARTGRVVPLDFFIKNSQDAYENLFKLADKYGSKITIEAIENTPDKTFNKISLDDLRNKGYNPEAAREVLYEETIKAGKSGILTPSEVDAILPKSSEVRDQLARRTNENDQRLGNGEETKSQSLAQVSRISLQDIETQARELRNKYLEDNQGEKAPPLDEFRQMVRDSIDQPGIEISASNPKLKAFINDQIRPKQEPTITESTALRESLRAQARAAREAAGMTREQIKEAQNRIVDIIDNSQMSLHDKGKFTRTIKNIQTQEQLNKALPEIEARIEGLVESATKRDFRQQIEDELSTTKVIKQSGKPKGKFTPETQVELDKIRQITKMTPDEAVNRINQNLTQYQDTFPPPEVVAENALLSEYSNLGKKTPLELQNILDKIRDLKETGSSEAMRKAEERKTFVADSVKKMVEEITGGKGIKEAAKSIGVEDVDKTGVKKTVKQFVRSSILAWDDFLNVLSSKSGTRAGESFSENFGNVTKEALGEKRGIRESNEKLANIVEKSYGVNNDEALEILRSNGQAVDLGTFKNANGKNVDLVLTKDQAIKKWMELSDPSLDETFFGQEGMAWSPDMMRALDQFLSTKDKKFAEAQLDFYHKDYKTINEVYRDLYGVDFPFNEFYSPIKRSGVATSNTAMGEFMQEAQFRRSVTSGSLKSRVQNIKPLEFTGASEVLQKHISEMERFKNWASKVRDLYSVFGDPTVKQAIVENHGSGLYRSVINAIEDYARGGIRKSNSIDLIDKWRNNFARSAVAIRPSIAAKQMIGSLAYLETLSPKEYISGILDFLSHPKENTDILSQSEFFKSRGKNIDRDLTDAIKSEEYSAFKKKPGFLNALSLNLRLGDMGAITLGGWGVYKKALAEGKTHEQALKEFSEVSNRTQQSSDLSQLSELQKGGSFAKFFTLFKSQPIQYLRRELFAIRNAANGRIPLGEAAKIFALYHFILPMTFQAVSDFGSFDKKNQMRAALLGNLNSLFIVGDMAEGIINKAMGLKSYDGNIPLSDIKHDFEKALFSIDWEDIKIEDVKKAVDGLLRATGKTVGIPLSQVEDMLAGLKDTYEGKYRKGIGGLLGWPKSVLNDEETSGYKY